MKYYYITGEYPYDCTMEIFEENLSNGKLDDGFDIMIEAVDMFNSFYQDNSFFRVFQVDDDGSIESVEGYAPDGTVINDADWEYYGRLTKDIMDSFKDNNLINHYIELFLAVLRAPFKLVPKQC